MKESDIVRAILKYLKTVPDCFCWKEHGGMYERQVFPILFAVIVENLWLLRLRRKKAEPRLCRIQLSTKYRNAVEKLLLSGLLMR